MKSVISHSSSKPETANVKLEVSSIDPRDAKIIATGLVYNKV